MGGFRLAVGRVSLVHTLCYCQHRARGRRARLDAGGQRMPCKFSSPSHPVLLSAQGPGGAEHVEVQEAGGGAPPVAWICCTPLSCSWSRTAELSSWVDALCAEKLQAELSASCSFSAQSSSSTHEGTICQNGSKGPTRGLNLLHTPELISNCGTVTPIVCISPSKDGAISMTPQRKGSFCCCQLWLKYQSCKALSVLHLCFF